MNAGVADSIDQRIGLTLARLRITTWGMKSSSACLTGVHLWPLGTCSQPERRAGSKTSFRLPETRPFAWDEGPRHRVRMGKLRQIRSRKLWRASRGNQHLARTTQTSAHSLCGLASRPTVGRLPRCPRPLENSQFKRARSLTTHTMTLFIAMGNRPTRRLCFDELNR
jgi:hypothetical protein